MSAIPASLSRPTSVTFSGKREQPRHDHCPLCIDSMVHPKEDKRPPAIIFLDMDGVMIGDRAVPPLCDKIRQTLSDLFPQVSRGDITDYHWTVAKGRHLHPKALQNLHSLIERIEASGQRALVVLSSAWRNDATLQQLREEAFAQHLFGKRLCGKTAPQGSETAPELKQGFRFAKGAKRFFELDLEKRADVIEFWLRDHGFNALTNFVVIDDDPYVGLDRFGLRFIETSHLFLEEHVAKAAKILMGGSLRLEEMNGEQEEEHFLQKRDRMLEAAVTAGMQPVEKWQDATPFTGRLVAYKTNAYYYQGSKPFVLKSSGAVNFAYVVDKGWSSEPGKQYLMSRLLQKEAVPSGCPLWDELLEKHPIQMRLATDSEIIEVSKAVHSDQAKFEYGFFYEERIGAILKRALNLPGED